MHVHRMLRNLSTTVPATLENRLSAGPYSARVASQAAPGGGCTASSNPPHQWQVPGTTVNQELRVFRLTLPAGGRAESGAHTGPGLVYVLEGTIRTSATSVPMQTYGAGNLFLDPAYRAGLAFRNTSSSEPAQLLLYHVSEKGGAAR